MNAWLKSRADALSVATGMFALMAALMAEFYALDGSSFGSLFDLQAGHSQGMLWTWRIGGLLTWPVFLWLLLRPHLRPGDRGQRATLLRSLAIVSAYGGGGLWLITSAWQGLGALGERALVVVGPIVAVLSLCLPYLYTWGFVAIYGFARDALAGRSGHGWVGRSLGAAVLGIYGIGALVYLGIALVLAPIAMVVGVSTGVVAEHLSRDLFAIALSTGNFVSQWYAFYRVDAWFDEQDRAAQAPGGPVAQPVAPPAPAAVRASASTVAATQLPDGSVLLPDGRLVTADGRVYVPQAAPTQPAPAQPAIPPRGAPPAPGGTTPDPPYGYASKG